MNRNDEINLLVHKLDQLATLHVNINRQVLLDKIEFIMDSVNERLHSVIQNDYDGATVTFEEMEAMLAMQEKADAKWDKEEKRAGWKTDTPDWHKANVIPKKSKDTKELQEEPPVWKANETD